MQRFISYLKIVGVGTVAVLLIVFSENVAASVVHSIRVCVSSMIPSMFAVMAISTYILSKGYDRVIFRPLCFLLRPFFRLDRDTLSVFLLSLIGGYPLGIKLLKERISQNKNYSAIAEHASVFCYCISPPFAVNMIGVGIYGSAEIGGIVYLSNALSCILLAAVYSRFFRSDPGYVPKDRDAGLVFDVSSAANALFTVCTILIAFNAALEAVRSLLAIFSVSIDPLLSGAFEISNLLSLDRPSLALLPWISAISAFGGICVIFQCFAICGNAFSLKKFLIGRLISAILSAGICHILLYLFSPALPASAQSGTLYRFSTDRGVWVLLVLMAMIFFEKNKKIFKKG
ncbi:MAG: hypothetical protein NC084_10860 [Bacteroides sp.]|nr:hypothetical protein [Eubacterium sp.]MCM1419357.1 hypothetical protein [Roseburia sp.]MCM1463195.1 hypothetical protein [Bacteroides sp.]